MSLIHRAYVALGSNLQQPILQVKQAFIHLSHVPQTCLLKQSALYRTKPLGGMVQPDYINAVALLETDLTPHQLLNQLFAIEKQQGRVRDGERWQPRTLDLDLLLYDNWQLQDTVLTLPHAGLYERAFVLYPLYDCTPTLCLPNGELLANVLARHSATDMECLGDR